MRAVHIERQPDDQPTDAVLHNEVQEDCAIGFELAALQRLEGARHRQRRVRQRQAYGLLTQVQPQQSLAGKQPPAKLANI